MILRPDEVIETVSEVMGFNTLDVLYLNSRTQSIVECRQMIYYFLRKYCKSPTLLNEPLAYADIGKIFKKNHATIMHGESNIKNFMKFNLEWRQKVGEINEILMKLRQVEICKYCGRPKLEHRYLTTTFKVPEEYVKHN